MTRLIFSLFINFFNNSNLSKSKLTFSAISANNFQILEDGDYVECAVTGKKIDLEKLTYWSVDLQEPYYSYKEAFQKRELLDKN